MPIFNAVLVSNLYQMAVGGDKTAAECLHRAADPLIRAIAFSVNRLVADDLMQEGHLKLQLVIVNKQFNPERGSAYSFFSSMLRNHMLDWIRKGDREYPASWLGDSTPEKPNAIIYEADIVKYAVDRFPNLCPHVVEDATRYVLNAVAEGTHNLSRGIVRTLCSVYGLDRPVAQTLYWVAVSVLRMEASGIDWQQNIGEALSIDAAGTSLLPEVSLLLGKTEAQSISRIFSGCYVKF